MTGEDFKNFVLSFLKGLFILFLVFYLVPALIYWTKGENDLACKSFFLFCQKDSAEDYFPKQLYLVKFISVDNNANLLVQIPEIKKVYKIHLIAVGLEKVDSNQKCWYRNAVEYIKSVLKKNQNYWIEFDPNCKQSVENRDIRVYFYLTDNKNNLSLDKMLNYLLIKNAYLDEKESECQNYKYKNDFQKIEQKLEREGKALKDNTCF